jgi:hypothetical protein
MVVDVALLFLGYSCPLCSGVHLQAGGEAARGAAAGVDRGIALADRIVERHSFYGLRSLRRQESRSSTSLANRSCQGPKSKIWENVNLLNCVVRKF